MNEYQAIQQIMKHVSGEAVISSTGYISRALYHLADRDKNFYMQGSMGCALGIGIGLALHSRLSVIVISGDGAALMSLGTLALHKHLQLRNLFHFILDNGVYESTGCQPTCSKSVEFDKIGFNTEVIKITEPMKLAPPRIGLPPYEITRRFMNAIKSYCV